MRFERKRREKRQTDRQTKSDRESDVQSDRKAQSKSNREEILKEGKRKKPGIHSEKNTRHTEKQTDRESER